MELLDDPPRRRELNQIIELPLDEQPAAMARLSGDRIPILTSEPGQAMNCFAFAFDLGEALHSDPVLNYLAMPDHLLAYGHDIHADGCFVRWLWINRLIERDYGGEVILYFAGGRPVHAAKRLQDGPVVSKWGGGHRWVHEVDDVPSSYGTHYATVRVTAAMSTVDLYREYLRTVYPIVWKSANARVRSRWE